VEVLCDHVNHPSSFVTRGEIFVQEGEYQILKEGFTFLEPKTSRYIKWYTPSSENTSVCTNIYIYIYLYICIHKLIFPLQYSFKWHEISTAEFNGLEPHFCFNQKYRSEVKGRVLRTNILFTLTQSAVEIQCLYFPVQIKVLQATSCNSKI